MAFEDNVEDTELRTDGFNERIGSDEIADEPLTAEEELTMSEDMASYEDSAALGDPALDPTEEIGSAHVYTDEDNA